MSDTSARPTDPDARLRAGDIELDRAAYLVIVQGQTHTLPLQEYRLLALLMEHADHVLPRATIVTQLWGPQFDGDPSTVAVHMRRLRKKLEQHPGAPGHLRTVRSIGYIFDTVPVTKTP